jgi:hypothetical protein
MLARESPDLLVPVLNCWGLSVSSQAADRDGIFLASFFVAHRYGNGKEERKNHFPLVSWQI